MVILHKDLAGDFEQFCRANPEPCPLLAVLPAGCRVPSDLAPGADIITDLPKYRIYRQGRMTEEVRMHLFGLQIVSANSPLLTNFLPL